MYGVRSFKWLMTVKTELIVQEDVVAFLCKRLDNSYVVVTRLTIDSLDKDYIWEDKEAFGNVVCLRGICFKEALENWWECKLKE